MEKDDFCCTFSFGDNVFGGRDWKTLVAPAVAERCRKDGMVPLLRDARGRPLKRNFAHVDDLVAAILAALDNPATNGAPYNVCMDEPVDYGAVAPYLRATRGLDSIDIPSDYHSNWLDNSRAKYSLDWRPRFGLPKLIEAAWTYRRAADDPRKVSYAG
jgi:nucleoside-diphosphate-sugar epimerase